MKLLKNIIQTNFQMNTFHSNISKFLFILILSFIAYPVFTQDSKKEDSKKEDSKKEDSKKEKSEKKKVDKDVVSELTATLLSDSVSIELKWTPPLEEGDVIIARSNEVIDTLDKLGISDSLGKHKSNKANVFNNFKDINLRPGDYYYAIVLVSQVKKKRVKLFPGVNYTITPVVVPAQSNNLLVLPKIDEVTPESDSVTNLKIHNIENTVRLTWSPPLEADKNIPKYTIYRSLDPLSNVGLMDKATKIGEVIHPETTFLDTTLQSKITVYYGVSVSINGKETIPLTEDKSFKKFYFVKEDNKESGKEEVATIDEKKSAPKDIKTKHLQISNISSEIRKDGILLAWTAPEGAISNATTYYIYESQTPIVNETNSKLVENAKRIGTIVHPDVTFLHPNLEITSPVYYGITTKTGDGEENLVLKEGQSFIKIDPQKTNQSEKAGIEEKSDNIQKADTLEKPIKKKKHKKKPEMNEEEKPSPIVDEANPDFNTIMTQYYKKERYTEALVKFKSLADRVSDNKMRAKSLFFAALCHYNLSEYSSALNLLLKEEVQMDYDKERVDFYVKRCLEKRGSK